MEDLTTVEIPHECPICGLAALECLLEGDHCWPFTKIPRIRYSDMRFIAPSTERKLHGHDRIFTKEAHV